MRPEIVILLALTLLPAMQSEARLDYGPLPGDWTPISKVAPVYPNAALEECISGWVVVGFILSVDGIPNDLEIVEAHPKGHFESSALKAVEGNRYNPRTENGVPIEVPDMKEKLSFDIPDYYPCPDT